MGPRPYPKNGSPGFQFTKRACGGDWCGLQRHQTSDGKIDEFTYVAHIVPSDRWILWLPDESVFLRASGTKIFVLCLFNLNQGGGREAPPTQENKKVHPNHSFWQKKQVILVVRDYEFIRNARPRSDWLKVPIRAHWQLATTWPEVAPEKEWFDGSFQRARVCSMSPNASGIYTNPDPLRPGS